MDINLSDDQIKQLWQEYTDLLRSTNRPNIENVIKMLDESDFKEAPASTKYHHAFKGGLLKHSLEVYYNMFDFKNQIEFFNIPEDSIKIMALLHDICKINCYKVELRNTKDEQGNWIKVPYYTFDEIEPIGHGDKSVMYIYECGVQLTHLERACIRNHMGFTDQEYLPRVSALFSKCPQSLILHWADLESTYIQGSKDLQPKFIEKLKGKNISESNELLKISTENSNIDNNTDKVIINNREYKLAPLNVPVDGRIIITLCDENNNFVNVYSPNGDGLPF